MLQNKLSLTFQIYVKFLTLLIKIKEKNWNQEWENSFKPVFINNNCLIRADFHKENLMLNMKLLLHQKCHLVQVIMKQLL